MAEVLILAFDTYGPDDVADRMAWKLGHVIDIKPDGHVWGKLETLPKFVKVKLPGITVEQVQKFLAVKMDFTEILNPKQVGLRKWKLDLNSLPIGIRNKLLTDGEIEVKKLVDFEGYMKLVS